MPTMYICICKNVTDRQIRSAVLEGKANTLRDLRTHLGACDQCGKCAPAARALLREVLDERKMLEARSMRAVA